MRTHTFKRSLLILGMQIFSNLQFIVNNSKAKMIHILAMYILAAALRVAILTIRGR